MINAPFARACVTRLRTFATESAQRCRRSLVQVWLVKSITSRAVSLGTMVAGLSAGGAGSLADAHSSITVCACVPAPGCITRAVAVTAPIAIRCSIVMLDPPRIWILLCGVRLTALAAGAKSVQARTLPPGGQTLVRFTDRH